MTNPVVGNTTRVSDWRVNAALFLPGTNDPKIGAEYEYSFTHQGRPISNAQNLELRERCANPERYGYTFKSFDLALEAGAHMLEINTGAHSFHNIGKVIGESLENFTALQTVCADMRFEICTYAQLPNARISDIETIKRPRAEKLFEAFEKNNLPRYIENFKYTTGAQASVSYKNPGDLLRNVRRFSYLAPVLATAFDNSFGLLAGRPDPQQTGLRLRHGMAIGNRGGIPDFFLTAQTGEELVEKYHQWTFGQKLIAQYNAAGTELTVPAKNEQRSFFEHIAKNDGLNTKTNEEFAATFVWPHIKLAYIKNNAQEIIGTRFEVRLTDNGPWQKNALPLVVAAVAMDEQCGKEVDKLLRRYGFDVDQPTPDSRQKVEAAIQSAINYGDEFGTGSRSGFTRQFGQLVEQAYKRHPDTNLSKDLQPFLDVCDSGRTDAQIRRNLHVSRPMALNQR